MKDTMFPLDLTKSTEKLKELILQYPDYPIVVLVAEDAVCDEYGYTYCSDISFGVGKILDCEAICKDEKVYSDKDDFIEDMIAYLMEEYAEIPDDDFEKLLSSEVAKYDPYWKDVITICVGN